MNTAPGMFYTSPAQARKTNESISSNFDDSNYTANNTSHQQLNVTSNTNDTSVNNEYLGKQMNG
jgi:hypothetical protein